MYKNEVGGSALVTWRSWRAMQAALVAILYLLTTIAEAQVLKFYRINKDRCLKLNTFQLWSEFVTNSDQLGHNVSSQKMIIESKFLRKQILS